MKGFSGRDRLEFATMYSGQNCHAIVRRSKAHAQSVIYVDDLCVRFDTKTVQVNGARVHLTGKEYQTLNAQPCQGWGVGSNSIVRVHHQ